MPQTKNGAVQFAFDARASLFTVQAFASGIAAVVAHSPKFAVRDFSGSIVFSPDSLEDSSLDLIIQSNSLDLMDDVRATERKEIERVMFAEVLETHKYPTVRFRSTRVTGLRASENMFRLNVTGDLNLHGVTRTVPLESQVMVGEETLKAQGSFSVRQSDFGLKIASVAGGSLTLKDEIKSGYFIAAKRQH
jgi:polyisoprenoid-binding protein YceI